MVTRNIGTLLLVTGLLGAFTWKPVFAQSEWLPEDATPIQKQFVDELGTTVFDYWNPRLNEYKRTVDRMLSPTDLQHLNEMRVRWSVLMADLSEHMKAQKGMADTDGEGIEMRIGEEDEEAKFMELFEIWSQTTALAQGYRSGLDNLSDVVLDDAAEFGDNVETFVQDFTQSNSDVLAEDEKGAELLSHKTDLNRGIDKFQNTLKKKEGDVMKVYGFVIEPIVLLFNGGDLRDMLPLQLGRTAGIDAGAVAGLLPTGAVLQQNVPNPASASTKISFTLAEPSRGTTLRLYSADGALVKSVDLGTLSPGERSYDMNVSDLANGSYLYHLTVTTSAGEMVYSKVMQVVR